MDFFQQYSCGIFANNQCSGSESEGKVKSESECCIGIVEEEEMKVRFKLGSRLGGSFQLLELCFVNDRWSSESERKDTAASQ